VLERRALGVGDPEAELWLTGEPVPGQVDGRRRDVDAEVRAIVTQRAAALELDREVPRATANIEDPSKLVSGHQPPEMRIRVGARFERDRRRDAGLAVLGVEAFAHGVTDQQVRDLVPRRARRDLEPALGGGVAQHCDRHPSERTQRFRERQSRRQSTMVARVGLVGMWGCADAITADRNWI
jgi:hypothetical protein